MKGIRITKATNNARAIVIIREKEELYIIGCFGSEKIKTMEGPKDEIEKALTEYPEKISLDGGVIVDLSSRKALKNPETKDDAFLYFTTPEEGPDLITVNRAYFRRKLWALLKEEF